MCIKCTAPVTPTPNKKSAVWLADLHQGCPFVHALSSKGFSNGWREICQLAPMNQFNGNCGTAVLLLVGLDLEAWISQDVIC